MDKIYLKDNHNRTYIIKDLKVFILMFLNIIHLEHQFMKKMDTFLQLMKNLEKNKRTIFKTYIIILSHSCN